MTTNEAVPLGLTAKSSAATLEEVRTQLIAELERMAQLHFQLRSNSDPNLVHSFRKLAKGVRAHLRLLRDYLPAGEFRRFDSSIAALARSFAQAREATVRIQTLQRLVTSELVSQQALDNLTPCLSGWVPALGETDSHVPANVQPTTLESDVFSQAIATLQGEALEQLCGSARSAQKAQLQSLKRQLRKTYRRGRRRLERASRSSATPPTFHAFRKQVKHHANQVAILAGGGALRERKRTLGELADLLGAHHDLYDLECCLLATPADSSTTEEVAQVVGVARRERDNLEAQALKLARQLYKRTPRRTARWVVRRLEPKPSTAVPPDAPLQSSETH